MAANKNNEKDMENSSERVEQPQPEKDPTPNATDSAKSAKPKIRIDPTTGVKIIDRTQPGHGGGMVLGLEHPLDEPKSDEPQK